MNDRHLTLRALEMALKRRGPDRGSTCITPTKSGRTPAKTQGTLVRRIFSKNRSKGFAAICMSLDVSASEEREPPVSTRRLSSQIVHGCGDAKSLSRWLLGLDSNQQPSG